MQRSFPGPSLARDLADDWKSVVFRGVLVALFGLLFLFAPAFSLTVGVYAFAGFALVFGVLALLSGFRTDSSAKWALIVEGIAGIAAGLIAFAWPGVVVVWIAWFIAGWAIISGVMEIVAAIRLRHEIDNEWLLVLGGVVSLIFGLIVLSQPGQGMKAITLITGIYALIFGGIIIALGFRLKSVGEKLERGAEAVAAALPR